MGHVIWDWNGTLLDDLDVVVEAVNAALSRLGAPPITADGYRRHYTRPVHRFYEALLGRAVEEDEWRRIDADFHAVYRATLGRARLRSDAADALSRVAAGGGSQSVLSMWWHDELVAAVRRHGIAGYMLRVDGNRDDAGDRKQTHLQRHLDCLVGHGIPAATVTMVGDSLDDADAAATNGIRCVLIDAGSHHRGELAATGWPVVGGLVEAVTMAAVP